MFHTRLLDFDAVLLLLDGLLETSAILPPRHQLQLVLQLLLLRTIHLLKLVIQLRLLDHGVVDLLLVLLFDGLHFILVVLDRFSLLFLVAAFE